MSDRYYPSLMPKKPPAPSDIADKFMLRMPEGMRDRIAAEAEKNKRSMNAEIIARLDASFTPGPVPEDLAEMRELVARVRADRERIHEFRQQLERVSPLMDMIRKVVDEKEAREGLGEQVFIEVRTLSTPPEKEET